MGGSATQFYEISAEAAAAVCSSPSTSSPVVSGGGACVALSWSITTVLPVSTTGEYETYAHRIANFTAREFGRQLVAVNLLAQGDVRTIREIEQVYKTTVEEMMPNVYWEY